MRLGNGDGAYDLAAHDGRKVFAFCSGVPRSVMCPADMSVWTRDGGEAAERAAAEFFGEHHRGERAEIRPAVFDRIPHAEQAELAHAAIDFAWNLAGPLPFLAGWNDFLFDESTDLVAHLHEVLRQGRRVLESELGGSGPRAWTFMVLPAALWTGARVTIIKTSVRFYAIMICTRRQGGIAMSMVLVEKRGAVTVLTLNNPAQYNALAWDLLREFNAALDQTIASDARHPAYRRRQGLLFWRPIRRRYVRAG